MWQSLMSMIRRTTFNKQQLLTISIVIFMYFRSTIHINPHFLRHLIDWIIICCYDLSCVSTPLQSKQPPIIRVYCCILHTTTIHYQAACRRVFLKRLSMLCSSHGTLFANPTPTVSDLSWPAHLFVWYPKYLYCAGRRTETIQQNLSKCAVWCTR